MIISTKALCLCLCQNLMNVDSDKARLFHLSYLQNPELHHEKEIIDGSRSSCLTPLSSFMLVAAMTKSSTLVEFRQAMVLSLLAGPINLRKFVATRPDGTRKPDF